MLNISPSCAPSWKVAPGWNHAPSPSSALKAAAPHCAVVFSCICHQFTASGFVKSTRPPLPFHQLTICGRPVSPRAFTR